MLANDTDVDSADARRPSLVSGPAHGTLTLNADGSFTYTPAPTTTAPTASPTRPTTARADSNTATVTITVNAVNDAPVAGDDSYSTDEDDTLNVSRPACWPTTPTWTATTLTAVARSPAQRTAR